jgi:ubiquinone/menaquinone biosynthesis C-methylase UbiE
VRRPEDPDTFRAEQIEHWEKAAAGWGKRAADVRDHGMPVSIAMLRQLELQPGQRVLELAAGPGDTGFLASELVNPAGMLVSSDASEAMLAIARARAEQLGITNVEFLRLELEWIDLPTASVDAILCRWALMLLVDPEAAAREMRRVLRPGGRAAVAVWDQPAANPWATVPMQSMIKLGHVSPPEPGLPGMFALAAPDALRGVLESAGFVFAHVEAVQLERRYPDIRAYLEETLDLSQMFAVPFRELDPSGQDEVVRTIEELAAPFRGDDGSYTFGGRALVAGARA